MRCTKVKNKAYALQSVIIIERPSLIFPENFNLKKIKVTYKTIKY
jgi:hypothetical protein